MSRGLISNRRLAGSCFKMALTGSIIVEICDETMAKMLEPITSASFLSSLSIIHDLLITKLRGAFACALACVRKNFLDLSS